VTAAQRPPRRWVAELVARGAVADPEDVRFAAFSTGELANAVLLGAVVSPSNPVGYRMVPPSGATGDAVLARASRRSGFVAVTAADLLFVRCPTAWTRPRGPLVVTDRADVRFVRGSRADVAVALADGSVARFSFGRLEVAAAFISLW
jgi:hypothetical protein